VSEEKEMQKKTIGIDGTMLYGKRAGVGRYIFEYCRQLDKLLTECSFFVYSSRQIEMPATNSRWVFRRFFHPILYIKEWLYGIFQLNSKREERAPIYELASKNKAWMVAGSLGIFVSNLLQQRVLMSLSCRRDELNAFWGGYGFLPLLQSHVKKIITVHDLNYLIVPETMDVPALWTFKFLFKKDLFRADLITTNSRGTAEKLQNYFGKKTHGVIYPGVSDQFFPRAGKELQMFLEKKRIDFPFFLAVCTWEPRKNLEILVKTFLKMKKNGEIPKQKLILLGGRGWKDDRLASLIESDQRRNILPWGYVEDADLPFFYSGCDGFIFPSLYEGFGMPVAEARSCGARIITSDIPELREAGGEEPIYIQPTSEGIREGILKLLSNPKNFRRHRKGPSWEEGGKKLADFLIS